MYLSYMPLKDEARDSSPDIHMHLRNPKESGRSPTAALVGHLCPVVIAASVLYGNLKGYWLSMHPTELGQ